MEAHDARARKHHFTHKSGLRAGFAVEAGGAIMSRVRLLPAVVWLATFVEDCSALREELDADAPRFELGVLESIPLVQAGGDTVHTCAARSVRRGGGAKGFVCVRLQTAPEVWKKEEAPRAFRRTGGLDLYQTMSKSIRRNRERSFHRVE